MIVYNFKTKRLEEIPPEQYQMTHHLKAAQMSQAQRELVVSSYIKVSSQLATYLGESTSNRVNLVNTARNMMIKGQIPLNLVVLMVLLDDANWEMTWRAR